MDIVASLFVGIFHAFRIKNVVQQGDSCEQHKQNTLQDFVNDTQGSSVFSYMCVIFSVCLCFSFSWFIQFPVFLLMGSFPLLLLCLFLTFVVPRFQYLIYKRFNQVKVWNTNKSFVCTKHSPGTNGNNFRHILCSFTRYNKYIIKLALLCSMVYLSDCNGCRRSLKHYSSSCYAVFGFLQT